VVVSYRTVAGCPHKDFDEDRSGEAKVDM